MSIVAHDYHNRVEVVENFMDMRDEGDLKREVSPVNHFAELGKRFVDQSRNPTWDRGQADSP
jgi:hypothetical protein